MSKELTESKTTELTMQTGDIFGTEGIDNADLMLPRLYLIQKMSPQIEDDNIICEPGDILNSLTNEVVKAPEIIPIFTKKFWKESLLDTSVNPAEVKNATKFPFTKENCNLKYEEMPAEGVNMLVKRHIELDWFCLLAHEVADGAALPCVVTFKKTSMGAGKKLNTLVKQGAILGKPACGYAYELKIAKRSMEKAGKTVTFFVFEIGKKRTSSEEEIASAAQWYQTLNTSSVKITELEQDKDVADEPTPF